MNLQEALRIVRTRWTLALAFTLLGIAASIIAFIVRPPEYTATTDLFVSAQVGDNPQQAYQGAQLSEQRVKSYSELVTSDRTLTDTARRLGLTSTRDELASKISATSAPDSVIINVSAIDASPEAAAALSNTAALVTADVVDQLERPASPVGVAPVAIRVVQPAEAPTEPSSSSLLATVIVGLLSGMFLGIAAAFARNALDTTVSSVERLQESSGVPNLGVTPFDADARNQPLAFASDLQGVRAESVRHVRTNLQFVNADKPHKIIAITSSVPAEGKTTLTANLAEAMSSVGMKVLLVEADLRRPRLSALLGLDRSVGLTSVLSGRVARHQATQPWNGGIVDMLASGPIPPNPSELLSSAQMDRFLAEARELYDIVLIDTPPLLPVTDAAALAPKVDGVVLACRFNAISTTQVRQACESLRRVGVEPIGTVLTMEPVRGRTAEYSYSYRSDHSAYNFPSSAGRDSSQRKPAHDRTRNGRSNQAVSITDRHPSTDFKNQPGAGPKGPPSLGGHGL
ncbi:polysaccharide biosynthesis tyrosine autokinase [Pseudonocardia spirodelae]|uniref:Polysaccharide biosynthesis tyrosine autokinase n=1 Tax=Pseudonocardia spirodelae TaxID=3133431 RepID=A0ABU8T2V9_9PSEU